MAYSRIRDKSPISPITKYFLFFENFVLWLTGLIVTVLGSYILIIKKKSFGDAFDFFLDPSTIMVTIGVFVFCISFFGCLGSLRENTCMLRTFNIWLTIMFFLELALIIFVFIFYFAPQVTEKLGIFPGNAMKDAIRKYGMEKDDDMVNFIDNIQRSLECCGLSNTDEGYKDWNENMYFNCSSDSAEKCSVPASCCKIKEGQYINILCGRRVMKLTEGKVTETENARNINEIGCLKALGEWINQHSLILGGILLGILIPQLFVMCLSRSLRDQIRAQRAKWTRNLPRTHDGSS